MRPNLDSPKGKIPGGLPLGNSAPGEVVVESKGAGEHGGLCAGDAGGRVHCAQGVAPPHSLQRPLTQNEMEKMGGGGKENRKK